ncbi:hypothetical protein [Streptomyces clavifer]|uniref:hypothetical protein n=1 Tax=Streptomyces clavifer TaxID=68188 RepID=UPI0033A1EDEB
MVTLSAPNGQDRVALAEIELCGELMIAASAAREDRLSPDRIDEVLDVRADRDLRHEPGTGAARGTHDGPGAGAARGVPKGSGTGVAGRADGSGAVTARGTHDGPGNRAGRDIGDMPGAGPDRDVADIGVDRTGRVPRADDRGVRGADADRAGRGADAGRASRNAGSGGGAVSGPGSGRQASARGPEGPDHDERAARVPRQYHHRG